MLLNNNSIKEQHMAYIPQPHLFTWKQIDEASDLDRLRLVLEALPDEQFMQFLEKQRGQGRDDYPIRPCWNVLLAGVVFQHKSCASLLRELSRNGELRGLCGFSPLMGTWAVPSEDAFGRFLGLVIEHQHFVTDMFDRLIEELEQELPDLGKTLAVDSKAIPSHGKPVKDEKKRQKSDGRRDTDANWGKKTMRGQRKDGSQWEKVTTWFGYKLHLLVDSHYELPLAFKLTEASTADSPELLPLVEDLHDRHPEIVAKSEELAADKGYDSEKNNRELYDEYEIKPVIDKRTLWKEEPTRALFPDRVDSFVYNEQGEVSCICPQTEEQRPLACVGFEKDRDALRYRCPAAAYGFECLGRSQCEANANVSSFGRVIRVPLDTDRRIFLPIARHTNKYKEAYKLRSSVERVNSRLDRVLGFEEHYIRGKAKMETRVTLALVVMLAMALGRIRANQADLMRSLTAPVRRAA
jgi:hypothetical protein